MTLTIDDYNHFLAGRNQPLTTMTTVMATTPTQASTTSLQVAIPTIPKSAPYVNPSAHMPNVKLDVNPLGIELMEQELEKNKLTFLV